MKRKRVLLLGATGSIGTSTLAVADNLSDELEIVALAANHSWEKMVDLIPRYRPESVALSSPDAAEKLSQALTGKGIDPPRIYTGADGLVSLVRETTGDVVVAAISGAAGLPGSLAALESGKDLALANKEALVMSGALLTQLAHRSGRQILPVDSEHSAIFQSLLSGQLDEVETILLTASGGPFRKTPADELRRVTKEQALAHPTWNMGEKITIDSATLMNKALEVIEARWLFDVAPDRIRVVVHPQSIIHSLVQFHDGSVICQLGPPDMKIPIQYTLTYPARRPLNVERLDLSKVATLTFEEPDLERFPAVRLAFEVLERGGTAPAVFNAANETAVAAFLAEEIRFPEIIGTVERTLEVHGVQDDPTLDQILAADTWARAEAARQLEKYKAHFA